MSYFFVRSSISLVFGIVFIWTES